MSPIINQIDSKKWKFYGTMKLNWFIRSTQDLTRNRDLQEKYFGFSVPSPDILILNGEEYYNDGYDQTSIENFDTLFKNDSQFFDKFADNLYKLIQEIKDYKNNIENSDIETFFEMYLKSLMPIRMLPDAYLEHRIAHLPNIPFPITDKLAYLEEPLDLLQIAKEYKNGNNIDKLLDEHVREFAWLKGPYMYEDIFFTKEDYLKRIKNTIDTKDVDIEIKKTLDYRKQSLIDYQEFIKKNNITGMDLIMCEATKKFVNLHTYMTETSDSLFFLGRHTILKKYAEKLGISIEDISMLEPHEIIEGDISKIKPRLSGYAIITMNSGNTYIYGPEANELQKYISDKHKQPEKQTTSSNIEIKGNSASLGKVTGRARIMLDYRDVDKMQKGEILVTTMTTPDYIAAMEKASAFVTDTGGVTCHAAIIAREFNVPCIIGTGNATKIIKDGDLIEVDANTGIVKVLQ